MWELVGDIADKIQSSEDYDYVWSFEPDKVADLTVVLQERKVPFQIVPFNGGLGIRKKPNRGGKREGSGRPRIGTTKKVSVTLTNETWALLDELANQSSISAVIREILEKELKKDD